MTRSRWQPIRQLQVHPHAKGYKDPALSSKQECCQRLVVLQNGQKAAALGLPRAVKRRPKPHPLLNKPRCTHHKKTLEKKLLNNRGLILVPFGSVWTLGLRPLRLLSSAVTQNLDAQAGRSFAPSRTTRRVMFSWRAARRSCPCHDPSLALGRWIGS
jgi:hypothetical protein